MDADARSAARPAVRRSVLQAGVVVGAGLFLPGCTSSEPRSPAAVAADGQPNGPAVDVAGGHGRLAGEPADGAAVRPRVLQAAPARVRLVPDSRPETPVWAYGGTVPGPTLRVRQGERVDVLFKNGLRDPSTVHWHGVRIDNPMDGVPYLTQAPVEPGSEFRYTFTVPDAGTYWYHPHLGTPEQVGRGLYGTLIVEEAEPPEVDRDLVWLVDDWRLDGQARIFEDFYNWSDVAFEGRVGNTVTVNGIEHFTQPVKQGERLRLRLVNVANARLVSLNFGDLPAWVMALDGNPLPRVARLSPDENVFLGPGQRADVILDVTAPPGTELPVLDRLVPHRSYRIARLAVGASAAAGRAPRPAPSPLAPHALPEPSGRDSQRVRITMDGGMMMGGMMGGGTSWWDRATRRVRQWAGSREADPSWTLNGRAHLEHGPGHGFEFVAARGRTVELTYENNSSYWHPMHLHGHMFRELTRNGRPVPMTPWRDTTMVAPRERLTIAFVADNPGDWLIHCHILEHHAGGMGTQFRVEA